MVAAVGSSCGRWDAEDAGGTLTFSGELEAEMQRCVLQAALAWCVCRQGACFLCQACWTQIALALRLRGGTLGLGSQYRCTSSIGRDVQQLCTAAAAG